MLEPIDKCQLDKSVKCDVTTYQLPEISTRNCLHSAQCSRDVHLYFSKQTSRHFCMQGCQAVGGNLKRIQSLSYFVTSYEIVPIGCILDFIGRFVFRRVAIVTTRSQYTAGPTHLISSERNSQPSSDAHS